MTTFAEDLRTYVIASTAIQASIGSGAAARMHYNHIPQDATRAYIYYRIVSDNEERTLDRSGGLHEVYLDIECATNTDAVADTLAASLKTRLDGFRGTVGDTSTGYTGHLIQGCWLADKSDDYEPRTAQDDGVRATSFDAHLFYST